MGAVEEFRLRHEVEKLREQTARPFLWLPRTVVYVAIDDISTAYAPGKHRREDGRGFMVLKNGVNFPFDADDWPLIQAALGVPEPIYKTDESRRIERVGRVVMTFEQFQRWMADPALPKNWKEVELTTWPPNHPYTPGNPQANAQVELWLAERWPGINFILRSPS